jgi:hypothetical protein
MDPRNPEKSESVSLWRAERLAPSHIEAIDKKTQNFRANLVV